MRRHIQCVTLLFHCQDVKPRLTKIMTEFGGVEAVAALVGLQKPKMATESCVLQKLLVVTKNKWRNTRHVKKMAQGTCV